MVIRREHTNSCLKGYLRRSEGEKSQLFLYRGDGYLICSLDLSHFEPPSHFEDLL